jgi:hypothetical protein
MAILGSGLSFASALALQRPWSVGPLLVVLGTLTVWVYAAGVLITLADSNETLGLAPVAIGTFAAGVTAFLGVLFLPRDGGTGLSDAAMRHALGTAFFTLYAALLVTSVFHDEWNHSVLGNKLSDNLTTWFGVAVAFYFSSTGAVEYLKYREDQLSRREQMRSGANPPPPG